MQIFLVLPKESVHIIHCSNGHFFVGAVQVHRACIEREIISLLDHPFLPTLYTSFQVYSFL